MKLNRPPLLADQCAKICVSGRRRISRLHNQCRRYEEPINVADYIERASGGVVILISDKVHYGAYSRYKERYMIQEAIPGVLSSSEVNLMRRPLALFRFGLHDA